MSLLITRPADIVDEWTLLTCAKASRRAGPSTSIWDEDAMGVVGPRRPLPIGTGPSERRQFNDWR